MAFLRSSRRALATAAVCSAITACGGDGGTPTKPADPCAAPGACEVQGADLILDRLALDAQAVAAIGMQAIPMGTPLNVDFTVRNRGSAPAPAGTLALCVNPECRAAHSVSIPVLAPGGTLQGRATLSLAGIAGEVSVAATISGDDAAPGNNARTAALLVERPDLRAEVRFENDVEKIRAGTEVRGTIIVRNAAHVAAAPASTAITCLYIWEKDISECREFAVPALSGWASHQEAFSHPLPFGYLEYADESSDVRISACADPHERVDQTRDDDDCGLRYVTLLTDVERMCPPATLSPGTPVSGVLDPEKDCEFFFASGSPARLLKFQAEANTPLVLELTSFPRYQGLRVQVLKMGNDSAMGRIFDRLELLTPRVGEPVTLTFTQSGTYYLGLYNYAQDAEAYTIQLERP